MRSGPEQEREPPCPTGSSSTITEFGYPGIFLLMLLEAMFPPIPSELIIPFAGFARRSGDLNPVLVVLAATTRLDAVGAMLPWYIAGRLFGLDRSKWLADRFGRWLTMNSDEIDLADGWFLRYGRIDRLLRPPRADHPHADLGARRPRRACRSRCSSRRRSLGVLALEQHSRRRGLPPLMSTTIWSKPGSIR